MSSAMITGGDILFLAHRAPWPPDRGDRIRSWHMFDALRKIAPVHVAALADNATDADVARAKITPLAASTHIVVRGANRATAMVTAMLSGKPASLSLFASQSLARHVGGLIGQGAIGHIVAFSSQMAQFVPNDCALPLVMDFVDVDSAKFEAYAAGDGPGPLRWVHAREGRLLAAWERRVAQRAAACLFVSAAESDLFRARADGDHCPHVRSLENGIDLAHFNADSALDTITVPSGPLIVFTGQMDYRPNIEAVIDFTHHSLPLVQARYPDAHFAIVGRAPVAAVRALSSRAGVIVTGQVADTRPWLAAASVVVAPLAVARGVQNKLLEAMAMARPVVASPAAALGIDATAGRDLFIADGPVATADVCVRIFGDSRQARIMGAAARARMAARYGWDETLAPLAQIIGIAPLVPGHA